MKRQMTQIIDLQQPDFLAEINCFSSLLNERLAHGADSEDTTYLYNSILLKSAYELHNILKEYHLFDNALTIACGCRQIENQLWSYQHLITTNLLQIGLLTLYQDTSVPLHDHPGAYGIQYVISGKVHIQQYQHTSDTELKQSILALEKVAENSLIKDEVSIFQPLAGNIHCLKSISKRSVLLSIVIHPYSSRDRSWYFPIRGLPASKDVLFSRVKMLRRSIKEKHFH